MQPIQASLEQVISDLLISGGNTTDARAVLGKPVNAERFRLQQPVEPVCQEWVLQVIETYFSEGFTLHCNDITYLQARADYENCPLTDRIVLVTVTVNESLIRVSLGEG